MVNQINVGSGSYPQGSGSTPVQIGQVLAGKYRVERVLGVGGMGVVVAARHLQLDESVAIKFLLSEVVQSAEVVERFAREARASIKIKSEHVVRVMDVGTLETGAPYMVMEYLHGGDLAGLLATRGPLPVQDAVDFVLQACEAVADAHALGIVHRDLKPANLFLTQRTDGTPCVKVLDFGISKVTGPAGSGGAMGMTKTSTVMGSPLYMSPEQMASTRDVDMRADIWAIGAILYELLVGQPPFNGDTLPQVCSMILQEPPPPMRQRRPDVPEQLESVVLKCLEKHRDARWRNMAELATALVDFGPRHARASAQRITRILQAAGLSTSAIALPPSSGMPPAMPVMAQGTMGSWGSTSPTLSKSSRWMWVGTVGAAILLVGIGMVVLLRGRKTEVAPLPATALVASAPVAADPAASSGNVAVPAASARIDTPPAVASTGEGSPDAAQPAKVPGGKGTVGKKGPADTAPPPATKKPPTKAGGLDLFNDNK